MKNIYDDGSYLTNNPNWHQEDSVRKAAEVLSILSRNGKLIDRGSVAEVGCGAGEILKTLQKTMPHIHFHGFEISPQAYKLCLEKQNEMLHYHNIDIATVEEKFDILLCMDVFEHVEDYMGFLRNIRPTSSTKIFRIPLDLSVNTLLRKSALLTKRKSIGHIHYFTSATAIASLIDCGYQIIDFQFVKCDSLSIKSKMLDILRAPLFKINPDLCARLFGGYSLVVIAK
jgi:hypothetical protein